MYDVGVPIGGALVQMLGNMLILFFHSVESFYKQGDAYYRPYLAPEEFLHAPDMYTTERSRDINGSDVKVEDPYFTPDFRIEEPPYTRYMDGSFFEEERPYRFSPHYKQLYRHYDWDYNMIGCSCCTVYKRLHPLATCCVITTRHILTTATSTELILRRYRHFKYLQNILGFWYDSDANVYNSSLYGSVARIHYHPKYLRPKLVNRSHPIPAIFDLSVWAATYRFFTTFLGATTVICPRAGSHRNEHSSAIPTLDDREKIAVIVGFQFMRAMKRNPMPWFKYMVKTKKHVYPCPKVDWGWFHCVRGNWAKLGLDQGAPLFRILRHGWRYNGLMGMNVVSMRLRSMDMMHYFQVLESHPVLDFMYDAFMGNYKCEWLDARFYDTRGRSPTPKSDSYILRTRYDFGREQYYGHVPSY